MGPCVNSSIVSDPPHIHVPIIHPGVYHCPAGTHHSEFHQLTTCTHCQEAMLPYLLDHHTVYTCEYRMVCAYLACMPCVCVCVCVCVYLRNQTDQRRHVGVRCTLLLCFFRFCFCICVSLNSWLNSICFVNVFFIHICVPSIFPSLQYLSPSPSSLSLSFSLSPFQV